MNDEMMMGGRRNGRAGRYGGHTADSRVLEVNEDFTGGERLGSSDRSSVLDDHGSVVVSEEGTTLGGWDVGDGEGRHGKVDC